MKINGQQIEKIIKLPDPSIRVFLFYGADRGLVHERVQVLLRTKVDDLNDPFRISYLTGSEIKKDPSRLMDEASAQSLVGGGEGRSRETRRRRYFSGCITMSRKFEWFGNYH